MSVAAGSASATIGPNAIVRTLEAVCEVAGAEGAQRVLARAGLKRYADALPHDMVDEAEVVALYRALREAFPPPASEAIAERAGAKTGEYILRHRIPAPARAVLRLLPARLSAKMLLAAIGKHAWTFAGSAHVEIADASPALVTLEGCPVCAGAVASSPLCRYYGATFECLFQRLVSAGTRVRESSCQALGDACCTFEIRYER